MAFTRANMLSRLTMVVVMMSFVCMCPAKYTEKVLLISMDGFRHDYVARANHTPNFDRLAAEGVWAPYVNPAFTTSTFPMHYTIVTGLYQESHGIVESDFYDPDLNDTFDRATGAAQSKWWADGEPIWITARKQGKTSASYFWVSSEVEIHGYRPNFWRPYNESVPSRERVDQVEQWFVNDSVDVAALYFSEPDTTGHEFGPDSDEVLKKVEELDGVLGYLLEKLENNGILDKVNIILTSDHGMTPIDVHKKAILLPDLLNNTGYHVDDLLERVLPRGAVFYVYPRANKTSTVYRLLKDAHPNMTVYMKDDIPERFHYKLSDRISPIVIVADEGWLVSDFLPPYYRHVGGHGYDNALLSMKPFFYARGPNFKSSYKSKPFHSVDIYPLMCELMGIKAAPNNGSLNVVQKFLHRPLPAGNGVNRKLPAVFIMAIGLVLAIWQ